jgi:hypothetical protein
MNANQHRPLYVSKASARSLWQEYRIYPDRLELKFWVFLTTLKIPAEKIVDLKIVSPVFKNKEKQKLMAWFWGLFLDWAAFNRHVLIETRSYFIPFLHFTPDDPDKFVSTCSSNFKFKDPADKAK